MLRPDREQLTSRGLRSVVVNAPRPAVLVRAGAIVETGKRVERAAE